MNIMLLTPLSFQGSSFWGPKNLQKMKKPKLPTAARKVFDKGRKLEKNNNTQKREMQNFRAVEEQIIQMQNFRAVEEQIIQKRA